MSMADRMLAAIEGLYDAALDESRWPQALGRLADFTGSQAASFWVLDGSAKPRLPVFTSINFDPAVIREYLESTAAIDPTVQYLVRHPRQPIVHDGIVITESEKRRHPYYDWHERHLDTRFRLVGQVSPAPMVQAGVALHRTRRAGRYEPRDIRQFAVLHRHLERALALGFRAGSMGAIEQCSAESMDHNPAAIFLIDAGGRVVFMNRSAESLAAAADGIGFSGCGITALAARENSALQALVTQALSRNPLPPGESGGVLRITRPSGKRPYLAFVSPVSRKYPALSLMRPAASIVVTDPAAENLLSPERLQAAFGLTHAEARLAALLASGTELREAAVSLKITYGTARTRLAEIFQKTETRRQGELISTLLTALSGV